MNALARTMPVAVIISLVAVTLAPAQEQGDGRVLGVDASFGADVEAAQRQYAQAETTGRPKLYSLPPASRVTSRSRRQVFIIPAAEIERENHLAIERDIHVMSHIFDRVLQKPVNRIGGVFTVMDDFFGRDSHVTQVIYLDGYGVLFFMDVDFALVGPPRAPQATDPNERPIEQVDTTWKQAERELYAPAGITRKTESESGPEYDAEKIELLKKNLVETLKHAANIQALKSDESVILTIRGRAMMWAAKATRGNNIEWMFRNDKWVPAPRSSKTASYPSLPPSVLTIRAKKADIDAFSNGEFNFTTFYERTQILTNWSGPTGATSEGMNWPGLMR